MGISFSPGWNSLVEVRVVGQIVGVVKMDSSQYIEYSIQDMDDPTRAVITVLEFKSVSRILLPPQLAFSFPDERGRR